MNLMIVEDDVALRGSLVMAIDGVAGIAVLAEAGSMHAVRALLDQFDSARSVCPDVVLLDMRLPETDGGSMRGLAGLELLSEIKERCPQARVLIYSQSTERDLAERAIREGADGYIHKNAMLSELISALEEVAGEKTSATPVAIEQPSMRSKIGARGEFYVVAQVLLFLLVLLGPRTVPGLPAWTYPWNIAAAASGALLLLCGAVLSAVAARSLGSNLTPLPYPRDDAVLVKHGPYGLVRHPIYSGLIVASFGWALLVNGWLTLVYALILFLFFDIKSRREERWLAGKFPGYAAYQRRVAKLIPWIY